MHVDTLTIDGAPAMRLRGPAGDSVTALLRGGQVISWVDATGAERLYCSPNSPLAGPQAVRGGVRVIFPQFNERGPLVRHGFARTAPWTVLPLRPEPSHAGLQLQMLHSAAQTPLWPHDCVCTLTLSLVPQGLRMALEVRNTGSTVLDFQAALHTYLEVGEVGRAALVGVLPQGQSLHLAEPIDQIFTDCPGPLHLQAPVGALRLEHEAFADVVVWNPGAAGAPADLPPGGHARFVCVEAAAIATPVVLPPGACWVGAQTLYSAS